MNATRRKMLISVMGATAAVMHDRVFAAPNAWPGSPVTFVLPYTAGGGTDLLARALAQRLGPILNTSVVVDNRPGAAGNIGAAMVAHDTTSHKFLFTTTTIAISDSLYKHLNYSLSADLQAVSLLTSSPLVLVVAGKSPIDSLDRLVKQSSKKPVGLNYGSPGIGSTSHLGCAVLANTLGIKAAHIPYKGASQVTTALISGQVDFSMIAAVAVAPHLRQGTLRVLGIAGKQHPPGIEQAPLLTDTDARLQFDNWQALFAPRSVSPAVVNRLCVELQDILKSPDIIRLIRGDAATPLGLASKQTAASIDADVSRYRAIVNELHLSMN